MELSAEAFTIILAIVGVVIMIAALLSGFIDRTNIPQVAIFLALGAIIGAPGLGLLNVSLESPVLRVVATLSLALVLFTDAVSLNVDEVRKHTKLTLLMLGPGTILSTVLVALAGWWLLGLPLAAAIVLGAALASTDPVLLRGFMRRRDISATTRQALRLESSLNDVVLLPIVLIAMAFMGSPSAPSAQAPQDWGALLLDLFLLGPGAGVAVGLLGVATLDLVRRRIGVRRDYESLYSLGVAFAAFAAAEAVHGSGFLAAFAAGLTIAALDVELCDCFLEYGETTAEMALLFTFVLFGSSLIWDGLAVLTLASVIFAVLVLLIRPLSILVALAGTRLGRRDRLLISWFGPRGLSSLLLVLLPVFAGVPGSEYLFAVCALVVLLSVVLHGGTLMLVGRGARAQRPAPEAVQGGDTPGTMEAAERLPIAPAQAHESAAQDGASEIEVAEAGQAGEDWRPSAERISIEGLRRLRESGAPVIVLDVRTDRTYDGSDFKAVGAIRVHPDDAVEEARKVGLPHDAWLVAFCA